MGIDSIPVWGVLRAGCCGLGAFLCAFLSVAQRFACCAALRAAVCVPLTVIAALARFHLNLTLN